MHTTINTNKINLKVSAFGEERNLVESKMNLIKFNSVEITFTLPLLKFSHACKIFPNNKNRRTIFEANCRNEKLKSILGFWRNCAAKLLFSLADLVLLHTNGSLCTKSV